MQSNLPHPWAPLSPGREDSGPWRRGSDWQRRQVCRGGPHAAPLPPPCIRVPWNSRVTCRRRSLWHEGPCDTMQICGCESARSRAEHQLEQRSWGKVQHSLGWRYQSLAGYKRMGAMDRETPMARACMALACSSFINPRLKPRCSCIHDSSQGVPYLSHSPLDARRII